MSFGTTKSMSPEEPKLFGVQREKVATNEAARVLPWFAGTRWLGLTWVGDAFAVRTEAIRKKVGKKKTTVGHNYYASFAGLMAVARADKVWKIKFNEELVWTGPVTRADEDFVSITVETRGVLHIHWGTETQTLHSVLGASGLNHYAYRGQHYLVGEGIFFGADTETAPNIQLQVSRWPRPSWITEEDSVIGGTDANPVAVLWDWWTDKRAGLGRPESRLDVARLTTVAQTLADEGIGVSPLLTSDDDFKTVLLKLFEHVDAFPTSYNGLLGVELVRPVTVAVPSLDDAALMDDAKVTGQTWDDTHDTVRVKFVDDALDGADNAAMHPEPANYAITGRHRALNVERPWFVRQAVAAKVAGALGRVAGVPQMSGSLSARASQVSAILVGSVFELTTRDGQTLRCRCRDRSEPQPGKDDVVIGFEEDRGWSNDPDFYAATADALAEQQVFDPDAAYAARVLDAPYALAQSDISALMFMVARGNSYDTAFDVWKGAAEAGPYESATGHRGGGLFEKWSSAAVLTADYSESTLPVDQVVGIAFDLLSPDATPLAGEWDIGDALNHQLLAFVGPDASEILSLFDVVQVSASGYTAKAVRALYDTRRQTHSAGQELWLQFRSDVESDQWPPAVELARWFRFQPYFSAAPVDFDTLASYPHTESGRNLLPLAPLNLAVDGDMHAAVWNTGSDVVVTWSNTSRARTVFGLDFAAAPATDLTAVSIELRSYDGATLHATVSASPTGESSSAFTNAYLVANVNDHFRLRAYGERNGRRSLFYTDVLVTKV